MVRYRKIVRLLAEDLHYQQIVSTSALGSFKYTLPITLAYVWEKATSKQCLLDYLLALESTMQQPILLPEFEELRLADSPLRRQWLESHFAPGEITAKAVFAASQVLLQAGQSLESTSTMRTTFASSPTQMISDATDTDTNTLHNDTATSAATTGPVVQNTGEALEVLAASYALERSFKTPIKLGRYAYGDGRPRPDCVEVVVREIFDALIYGTYYKPNSLIYVQDVLEKSFSCRSRECLLKRLQHVL